MDHEDAERYVYGYGRLFTFLRNANRVTGLLTLAAGGFAAANGKWPLAVVAVVAGVGMCWLGWIVQFRVDLMDAHWDSRDEGRVRRFRRRLRRGL